MKFDDKVFLGEQIKLHRNRLSMTQEDLAKKVNLSAQHISRIERGEYTPSLNSFFLIVLALNIDLEIFGYTKESLIDTRKEKLKQEIISATDAELIMYEELMVVIKRGLQKIKRNIF